MIAAYTAFGGKSPRTAKCRVKYLQKTVTKIENTSREREREREIVTK
jgi:hypothetical protein